MGTQIFVNVDYGNSYAKKDDIERAEKAALEVLAGHNISAVFEEFKRQLLEFDDYALLTGDAHLWVQAELAANSALTAGWHNPDGAGCSLGA